MSIISDTKVTPVILAASACTNKLSKHEQLEVLLTTGTLEQFRQYLQTTQIIDFRDEYIVDRNLQDGKKSMNWLQFACLFASLDMVKEIKRYMHKNFSDFNFAATLNDDFYYPIEVQKDSQNITHREIKKTTLGSLLFWVMSAENVYGHLRSIAKTPEESAQHERWLTLGKTQTINLPRIEGFIHINRQRKIEYLAQYLNVFASDHNDETLLTVARKFAKASRDPMLWNAEYKNRILYYKLLPLSSARNQGGNIVLDAMVTNGLNLHPRALLLMPDYLGMAKVLEEYILRKSKQLKVIDLDSKLSEHEKRLKNTEHGVAKNKQSIIDLNLRISRLSEDQYNRIYDHLAKEYPNYLETFKVLHKKLEGLIRQRGDASLQIFNALPMTNRWKPAIMLAEVCNVVTNVLSIPGGAAVPFLLGQIISFTESIENVKKSTEIFLLDANPHALATMIAALLINESIKTYGDNPPANITEHNTSRMLIFKNKVKSFFHGKEKISLSERLFRDVRVQFETKDIPRFDKINDAVLFFSAKAINRLLEARNIDAISLKDTSSAKKLTPSAA